MDWLTYLDLARELAAQAQKLDEREAKREAQARWRSAISRAYYAMYCTARDKLQVVGDFNPPQGGSDHIYLWNVFAGDPYRATSIRDLGQRLRDTRVQADYHPHISNLPHTAEGAIMDAEELQEALDALLL